MAVPNPAAQPNPAESDELAILEQRVARAVAMIQQLREERDTARKEAATLRQQIATMESERESLRSERKAVRTRIEKLLGQMDLLSSES